MENVWKSGLNVIKLQCKFTIKNLIQELISEKIFFQKFLILTRLKISIIFNNITLCKYNWIHKKIGKVFTFINCANFN